VLSLKTKNIFFLNMPQFYQIGAKNYHAVPASKNTECHLRKPCSAGSGVTITDFLPGCLEGNPPAIAAPIGAVPNRKQQGIPSSADKLKKNSSPPPPPRDSRMVLLSNFFAPSVMQLIK
jgi:hypothetical protein